MTHMLVVVKAIGITKNRDRAVVSHTIDGGVRKNSFFLNFSHKSLGSVDRLFQYRSITA